MSSVVTVNSFSKREKEMDGKCRLGFFDCEVGAILLVGCTLYLKGDGGLMVLPPMPMGRKPERSGVTILQAAIRDEMKVQAASAYRALGGSKIEEATHGS